MSREGSFKAHANAIPERIDEDPQPRSAPNVVEIKNCKRRIWNGKQSIKIDGQFLEGGREVNIVTLTTIPPRMDRINETLASLLGQSLAPDRIILNIPQHYRRPDFAYDTLPKLPSGIDLNITDQDYGPATKLLPTLRAYHGKDVNIIFCDDDRIYPTQWLSNLVENSKKFPNECITVAAGLVDQIEAYYHYVNKPKSKFLAPIYRKIYTFKKRRPVTSHFADIACGYGGILVRPDFFDDEVFNIKDEFYTLDDTWISGHLARLGIKIRVAENAELPSARDVADVASLKDLRQGSLNQNAIDYACIQYFRNNYGIWKS